MSRRFYGLCSLPVLLLSTPVLQAATEKDISLLEEIVVSVRHKDEQLTEVPASVTAYTSDFLDKQNIQSFADYATKVPNMTFQYGQGTSLMWAGDRQTAIRGVAGTGTTSYYINDTPVPSSVSPQTLGLDRIEVLKGPQGTLFGASSMGGNLRFITSRPSLSETNSTAQVSAGHTTDAGTDGSGALITNAVLVPDQIGLLAGVEYTHESGFIKRSFPDASGNLITRDGEGRNNTVSVNLSLRTVLSDAWELTVNGMGQNSDLHGFPGAYVPLPVFRPVTYTTDRAVDVQEYSKDRWGLASVVLNYSGSGYSFVSSTSYFSRRIKQLEDNTEASRQMFAANTKENPDPNGEPFIPDPIDIGNEPIPISSSSQERRLTQEARLSFDQGTLLPNFSGIVGVFYQHTSNSNAVGDEPIQALVNRGEPPYNLGAGPGHSYGDQYAVFGEGYYEVIPKLTITVGLRQYWIKQHTDPVFNYGFIFGPAGDQSPALDDKQSGLVPKAVVSYKIGNQGNVYASVSKGFRPGGTQTPLADICDPYLAELGLNKNDLLQYKSDTLWNYEVGAKSLLADGRISASIAAFQIDWSKIQQTQSLGCALSYVTNAGKARIRGGELELAGAPIADVPFTLQLGLGYTDGVLVDPGVLTQEPNTRLTYIPEWTGTLSGYYERPLAGEASLFMAADYSYTGQVKVPNTDEDLKFLKRQSFNLINANMGVKFGNSEVMLYGKNLADKRLNFGDQTPTGFERTDGPDGMGYRYPRATVSRPRQWGVQYQLKF